MSFAEIECDPPSTVSQAARIGKHDQLVSLINEGHPIDVSDNRGWRPLHEAAYGNHLLCLCELLKLEHSDKTDVNWPSHQGMTPLFIACLERHVECARVLLTAGADPNRSDFVNTYPLYEAVKGCSLELVQLLVEYGAQLDVQLYCGTTPLHHAASEGMEDILQYLLQKGARLDVKEEYNITPIFSAAQHGQAKCLKMMLEHANGTGQTTLLNYPAEDGATPLYLAAQNGHYQCVRELIAHNADANIMTSNEPRALPIIAAMEFAHVDCISALMPVTDTHLFDHCDMAPWYTIFTCGEHNLRHDMARVLLEGGADPNYQHSKDVDDTFTRYPKILRFLPTEAMLFYKSIRPLTKAAYFESAHHPSKLIKLLIGSGAYLDAQSVFEMAPILPALENCKLAIMKTLVENGACIDIYHPNLPGNLAILLSMHRWKSLAFLLHNGAEVESMFDNNKYLHQLDIYEQKLSKHHKTTKNGGECVACREKQQSNPRGKKPGRSVILSSRKNATVELSDTKETDSESDDKESDVVAETDDIPHKGYFETCEACLKLRCTQEQIQAGDLTSELTNITHHTRSSTSTTTACSSAITAAQEENYMHRRRRLRVAGHVCGGSRVQQDIISTSAFIPISTFFMAARQVMSGGPYHVSVGQVLMRILQYAGTINPSHSITAYIDSAQERDQVLRVVESPRSMAHLSRVTIRRCLGTQRIFNERRTRRQLALPRHILDYIFMLELKDDYSVSPARKKGQRS